MESKVVMGNSRESMAVGGCVGQPPPTSETTLDRIPFGQAVSWVIGLRANHASIDLDGARAVRRVRRSERARYGGCLGRVSRDAVDGDLHPVMIGFEAPLPFARRRRR